MGDSFFVFELIIPHTPDRLELNVRRAHYAANVAAPPLGQMRTQGLEWNYTDVQLNAINANGVPVAGAVAASLLLTRQANQARSTNIELQDQAGANIMNPITDAEATRILAWAEQLCSATAKERTPWLNDADRRPHIPANNNNNQATKVWSADADLWGCPFARILVTCNPITAADRPDVVRKCRRAVVSGYTPCSNHMWDHADTTDEDRVEIAKRWVKEALVRRLVASFRTPNAANDAGDNVSFGAVRRLLALYLFVSAITQGTSFPNFATAHNHDFREDQARPHYMAVFVKLLHH